MFKQILQGLKSPISITLISIMVILLVSDYNLALKNEKWKYTVHTDAADYYSYLPAVFIDHHFDENDENPVKYFVGTAIMNLPFFGMACMASFICGYPVDGTGALFTLFISLGTLFYFIIGLYFFSKFLEYYISRTWVICLTLATVAFSTVIFYYTVHSPGWAHIPAFAISCFLLFHFKKITVSFNRQSVISIIAGLGLLFFVRPTDSVILVIAPFIAGDFKTFLEIVKRAFKEKTAVIIGVLLALIPLICQLSIYKAYSGSFIIWSYSKEGFNFLEPEIFNVLFSYAKGFFVYTPICFVALFGLVKLTKTNRFLAIGVGIYILLNVYIISSWWCWNYGYSYGPRAFIEHYPLFFLLLALLLDVKSLIQKTVMIIIITLLTFLNLFQINQATNGILDHDFKTDKAGYWNVFLSNNNGYSGKFYRYPVDESRQNIVRKIILFNDMEKRDTTWLNSNSHVIDKAHSGKYSSKVNQYNWYSSGLYKKLSEVPYNRNSFIRVSGWVFIPKKGSQAFFAIGFSTNEGSFQFNPHKLDGYIQEFNEWQFVQFEMPMPHFSNEIVENPDTKMEFYLFNNSEIDCYLDDLKIEFIEFKKMDRVLDLSWD